MGRLISADPQSLNQMLQCPRSSYSMRSADFMPILPQSEIRVTILAANAKEANENLREIFRFSHRFWREILVKFSVAHPNPGERSTENFTKISRQISRHLWQRKTEKIFTSALLQGSCSDDVCPSISREIGCKKLHTNSFTHQDLKFRPEPKFIHCDTLGVGGPNLFL